MKLNLRRLLHKRVFVTGGAVSIAALLLVAGLIFQAKRNGLPALSDPDNKTTVTQQKNGSGSNNQNYQNEDSITTDKESDNSNGSEVTETQNSTDTSDPGGSTQSSNPAPSPSPSPSPTPSPSSPACNGQTHVAGGSDGSGGCWPGPDNTGVPDGVVLSTYSGPTTFSSGTTTIDSKLIYDDLVVTGTGNLIVKNSKMTAHFDADTATGTLTIIDSEIDGTSWVGATVGFQNVTILRSNIYGSQHSVLCGDNCSVTDSWLHDQYEHNGDHNNAYISNGGSNVTLRHNTLHCTPSGSLGGGCSSNASFFGDFATIQNITMESNLLLATPSGGYCAYLGHDPPKSFGSNPSNVVVTNNYFQKGSSGKCGITAAVTSFLNANGNIFTGNKFTDGTPVSY